MDKHQPIYRTSRSYQWNYEHPPPVPEVDVPVSPLGCELFGHKLASPLGIAAGPLLNGAWIRSYAARGFDFLTYKTVRTRARCCYPLPNLVPVDVDQMQGTEDRVNACDQASMRGSWAVSFGMPSQPAEVWRQDVQATRAALPTSKLLSVSVVGTMQEGWGIEELAEDYAQCARWAVQAGADCVETNFSCPNVASCDGQLYQDQEAATLVARRVRDGIGGTPLLVKIGHFRDPDSQLPGLVDRLAPYVDAFVTTNSVAAQVVHPDGQLLFDGQPRGICGAATRRASLRQTAELKRYLDRQNAPVQVIGVGGIETARHVEQYLDAGATAVQLATAAMLDPDVAITIRRQWRS